MKCEICDGRGLVGWLKPAGWRLGVLLAAQFCQCWAGQDLAKLNSPDAKRAGVSSVDGLDFE